MSYGNSYNPYRNSCHQPEMSFNHTYYTCCASLPMQQDPIYPVYSSKQSSTNRNSTRVTRRTGGSINIKSTNPKLKKKNFRSSPAAQDVRKTFNTSNRDNDKNQNLLPSVEDDACDSIEPSSQGVGTRGKSHKSPCPSVEDDDCDSIEPLRKSVASNKSKIPYNECICTASEMSNRDSQKNERKSVKPAAKSIIHPDDCCCTDCDKVSAATFGDNSRSQKRDSNKSLVEKSSCSTMTNASAEKNLRNYLYDNTELKQSKHKKGCVELDSECDFGPDTEVWLLQCPKGCDPKKMLDTELGKMGKQKMDCSADRFSEKKTLAIIAPEKAAEYELICDSMKLVKTVGKIVVSEHNTSRASNSNRSPQRKSAARKHSECSSSNGSNEDDSNAKRLSDDDDDESVSSEAEAKPLGSKKLSKQVDDQCFTIETTVRVQKCGDKKKARKDDNEDDKEPSPTMKRKKSTKNSND